MAKLARNSYCKETAPAALLLTASPRTCRAATSTSQATQAGGRTEPGAPLQRAFLHRDEGKSSISSLQLLHSPSTIILKALLNRREKSAQAHSRFSSAIRPFWTLPTLHFQCKKCGDLI